MPLRNNHHHHHNDKSHQSISFFETSFADEGGAFLSAPEERVDDSMAWEPWPTEQQQQPKKTHKATKKQPQEQQSFGNSSSGGGPLRARSSPSRNSSSTNHNHQHQVVAPDDSLWGNASGFDSMLLPPPSTASTTPIQQRNMDFDSSAHDWFAVPSGTAGTKQPQPPPSSSSSSKGPAPSAFLQEQQRLADSKSQDWGIRPGVSGDEEFGTADAQWHTNPNLSLSQSSDHNLDDSHEPSPQQQSQPQQGRDATSSSNVWDPHQAPDFSLATTNNNSKNNNSNSSGRRGSLGRKQGRSKRDMDPVVMVLETSSSSPRRLSASPSKTSKNSKGVSPSSASATTPTSQSSPSSSKGKGFMGRFFGVRLVGSSVSCMFVSCTSTDPSGNSRYFGCLFVSSSLFL